ncbi:hypothetical protein [Rhizobium leguminosarum]|jgi:hypothetical protein|uniref:hypothetical protein n=1 Tax=Rhizobium leguminosarum TaxID=384 RepID=UPI001031C1BE|nr:hypothetical protein [Rhizobium leguminosarum]TAX95686.1 hypothetical protein ELH94_03700 [Rhizobium leguminosarum]TAY86979.1 hypothetical protein ELH83_03690 [Rhizobium leguminosarum]TAY97669.1 hypothetical protein ELH79_03865 [Rhizobium leguminosarum]TAZ08440.1 hypothetical protein ELH78_03865 [Rhizobium leguminosarum]
MKPGDVVRIYAPVAGYKKYHFCICLPGDNAAGRFLYLNSDPNHKDCLNIECKRIPFLPASETGYTAISFSIAARYTAEKLELYDAEVLGTMPQDVVEEMAIFIDTVRSMPKPDRVVVKEVLAALVNPAGTA